MKGRILLNDRRSSPVLVVGLALTERKEIGRCHAWASTVFEYGGETLPDLQVLVVVRPNPVTVCDRHNQRRGIS